MPNWIGDLVMATPVLVDLRARFPKAVITAMCKAPLSELLKEESAIDELYSYTRPSNSFLRRKEKRDIVEKLRRGKYDLGILLTNSFSSAWWFWQGRVKRRVGYRKGLRSLLLTDAVSFPNKKQHQVDLYKGLLEEIGIPHSKTMPRLVLTEKEIEESKELLYRRGLQRGKKLVGINPGASYGSAKCWPLERYRELAKRLLKDPGLEVVFFGDSGTFSLVKEIVQGLSERVINLAGVTSLRELACIIQEVDLLITNDSGPMHVGAALGTPLIALFGSTDEERTGPYGQEEEVIRKKVACSPCFKRVCPIDFRCMKGISVDEVFVRAEKILRGARV